MGVDFFERAKKAFRRSWDCERVALATPDLLQREPGCADVSVAGDIVDIFHGDSREQLIGPAPSPCRSTVCSSGVPAHCGLRRTRSCAPNSALCREPRSC
jgi:hypothetical protein